MKSAIVHAGLWLTVLECVCVWGVASGPYEGAAHWGKMTQSAMRLLRHGDSCDPWFSHFAEGIADDHGDRPLDF